MQSETRKPEWESSYGRRENFMFWPQEDVIRFFAAYIAKRTGLHEITTIHHLGRPPRVLDLGCGIGRHFIFAHEMGCVAHGIDLSEKAIETARTWAVERGFDPTRLLNGSADRLPFESAYFDFMVSHGVLDSMPFETAQRCASEAARVLAVNGLFYCDLISGWDSRVGGDFSGEVVVDRQHEEGTIQSYFNEAKIRRLFEPHLEIVTLTHRQKTDLHNGMFSGRWHVVLKKLV